MKRALIAVGLILVVAVAAIAYNSFSAGSAATHSVEMSVSRLSCGSCVETIRSAVSALKGAVSVETDVAAARSYVEFRGEEIDAEQIAATITASGYPATILFVRDSTGETLTGIDTEKYVARVGSRLIERDTFNDFFSERMGIAEATGKPVTLQLACQDAWRSILQQELLLNAADQFGITVSDEDLSQEMANNPGLNKLQLRNEMKIKNYFSLQYPDREPNSIEKNNMLNSLYSKTVVDIFDSKLKQQLSAGKGGSGCGGSCCG